MTIKMKINQVCGRLLIVTDNVTHQHINDVIINGNSFLETRHSKRMTEEGGRVKGILKRLYR